MTTNSVPTSLRSYVKSLYQDLDEMRRVKGIIQTACADYGISRARIYHAIGFSRGDNYINPACRTALVMVARAAIKRIKQYRKAIANKHSNIDKIDTLSKD